MSRQSQNQIRAVISGTGADLPEKVLTNSDLEQMVDTENDWIVQRTGIAERRIAEKDTSTSDLAANAARQALKSAQIELIFRLYFQAMQYQNIAINGPYMGLF